MADQPPRAPFLQQRRFRIIAGVVVLLLIAIVVWLWVTAGRESTDDAQVDAHVTQIAARVGGTILQVAVADNQQVDAGAVLVEIDPRDYQVAVDKARAELADAQAAAVAAQSNVPITSTTATSNVANAQGSVEQARSAVDAAQREVEAAHARLATAQARQREAQANATKTARDVERLRGLLATSQIAEAAAGIRVAESRLVQARAGQQQAEAGLRSAQTAPEQVAAMRARAESAQARVKQTQAALAQAELNLQYTTVKAPQRGVVSRKSVEMGQVVQPGQPLLALIPLENVWITANFKETQLTNMRPGQRTTLSVDAYGRREFKGHVDSIAPATGARFSLLPPENATGNYVKVVQRVPVKIVLEAGQDPEHLLRPGMSVVPTVYTK